MYNETAQDQLDQTATLQDALDELPERVEFSAEIQAKLGEILEQVAINNSEKPYHNQDHTITVMKRCFRIWKALQEVAPDIFDDKGYELLAFAAVTHDLFKDFEAPGEDESQSALAGTVYMDGLYDNDDKERVFDAIIATTVQRSEETGVIEQIYLKQGSKDPVKLVLCIADANGIALEGTTRMINDAVNLHMEFGSVSAETPFIESSKELGKFLALQASFLKARLDSLPSELDYFFPEDEFGETRELIIQRMRQLLHPGIAALSVAELFQIPSTVDNVFSLLSQQQLKIKDTPSKILELLHITP